MRYSYKAAWAVIGGIALANDGQPVELSNTDRSRFTLVRDADGPLALIDRGAAIGRLMLKGIAGKRGETDFQTALASEIAEIQAERRKMVGGQAMLVVEATGVVDASLNGPTQECEDFIATFDAIDKKSIKATHRADIEAMMLAIAIESETPSKFAMLSEGSYLINDDGKVVHSISLGCLEEN